MFRNDEFGSYYEEEDNFDEMWFRNQEEEHILWDTIKEELMDDEELGEII